MSRGRARGPRLIVFEGRQGWYWRLVANNNRVLAIGAEPFTRSRSARASFNQMCAHLKFPMQPTLILPRQRRRVRR